MRMREEVAVREANKRQTRGTRRTTRNIKGADKTTATQATRPNILPCLRSRLGVAAPPISSPVLGPTAPSKSCVALPLLPWELTLPSLPLLRNTRLTIALFPSFSIFPNSPSNSFARDCTSKLGSFAASRATGSASILTTFSRSRGEEARLS